MNSIAELGRQETDLNPLRSEDNTDSSAWYSIP